jgi:hypothetical protein
VTRSDQLVGPAAGLQATLDDRHRVHASQNLSQLTALDRRCPSTSCQSTALGDSPVHLNGELRRATLGQPLDRGGQRPRRVPERLGQPLRRWLASGAATPPHRGVVDRGCHVGERAGDRGQQPAIDAGRT